MNILVIGNGFDLAHGLPTRYTDFLEFCKRVMAIFNVAKTLNGKEFKHQYLDNWETKDEIKQHIKFSQYCIGVQNNESQYLSENSYFCELKETILNNIWIEYFLQCNMYHKENWIDFENEIMEVIESINNDMRLSMLEADIYIISNKFLKNKIRSLHKKITYRELRDRLVNDLNMLIRAIELYLTYYVEEIDIKVISPDVESIAVLSYQDMGIAKYGFNRVISFNYTNTYQTKYLKPYRNTDEFIDYIHGKADLNNTIESSNLVLGINEYLPDDRKDKDVDFIAFKKFYQRIYKQTGCKYKEWIDKIIQENSQYREEVRQCKLDYEKNRGLGDEGAQTKRELKRLRENPPVHNLYIFGHSLDVTDKDILKELIMNDYVHTTIFYLNKDVMGQQIANLVKVIGQDELIKRTGAKIIEFKQQQDMVPIQSDSTVDQ